MNFAKNLLKNGRDHNIAITSILENGQTTTLSYLELKNQVYLFQQFLKPNFVEGDVLACYMPNISETIIAMLAATSLGGVFTSTSCDFGVSGVIDRFFESKPKVLVCVNGYFYNGKYISLVDKILAIKKKLPSVKKVVVIDFLHFKIDSKEQLKLDKLYQEDDVFSWNELLANDDLNLKKKKEKNVKKEIEFVNVKASAPLYIMYSSGTTGKPKCIVHSVGGTLLQHIKELGLHTDLKEDKKILYFTTCGWMMWNWLVSSLYFGSNLYLYEGSPAYPSLNDFFKIIDEHNINIWGTSPKFLKALEDSSFNPLSLKLASLETVLSTGAPLLPEQYDFVYKAIKKNVLLASISGGTDILGCFMLGNPLLPVSRGEIQCIGLGMEVASFSNTATALIEKQGELVCLKSFPSRPLYFLNDLDEQKMKHSYFEKFSGIWHHGDFITISKENAVIMHGRSDATLNPGGVRIGTAEIYRQTEKLEFIEDSICVAKEISGDVVIILCIKLKQKNNDNKKANKILDDEKIILIKKQIRQNTTPRHVPQFIFQVSDIPYTRSGKKMELVVRNILAGIAIDNIEAVSNSKCLIEYQQIKKHFDDLLINNLK